MMCVCSEGSALFHVMKFRFYKTKSHTHTNACFNRAVFGVFDVRTSNIVNTITARRRNVDEGIFRHPSKKILENTKIS